MVGQIIEGTILLVAIMLILTNANGFYTVASAIGSTYVAAVQTLQGYRG